MLSSVDLPFKAKQHITEHTYNDGKKPCTVVLRSTTDLPATVTDEGGVYKANGTDDVLVLKGSLGAQLNAVLKTEPFDDSDVAVDEKLVRRIKALTKTKDGDLARTMAAFLQKRKRARPRKVAGCIKLLRELAQTVLSTLILGLLFFLGGTVSLILGILGLLQEGKQKDGWAPSAASNGLISATTGVALLWKNVISFLVALFESFYVGKECAAICAIIVVVLYVASTRHDIITMSVAGVGLTVAVLLATR